MFWAFFILGCGGENLSQAWQLDRTRILGVRPIVDTEPDPVLGTRSEPRPGETLRFEALTYTPETQPIGATVWTACVLDEAIGQCEFEDDELNDMGQTEEGSGLIGFEPLFVPVWTIPSNVLDGLSTTERQEGLSALVNVITLPEDVLAEWDGSVEDADAAKELNELDPNEVEIAFKRVPVSEAETPNHNPEIIDVLVAGHPIGNAEGFTARTGKTYILEPILPNAQIETYIYRASSGEQEYRTEEPYFSWYTEIGADDPNDGASFDQEISLYPYSSAEWTAPKNPGRLTIHIVARDRRGGMAWRTLTVNVL